MPLDRIIASALAIIDEQGPEALSMRSLAQRLNSSTATLYRHFASRAALIAQVVDAVIGEVDLGPSDLRDQPWQQACEATAHAMFDALRRHPRVAPLMIEQIPLGPNAFAQRERALAMLLDAGFAPPVAVRAWATLARYVLGFAIQFNADDRDRAPVEWPDIAGPFPASAAVAEHVPVPLEEEVAFGLRLLLSGLAQA